MIDDAGLRLAGFALAHAAWSVEDGETLCTLALVEVGGDRELVRYEAPTIPDSLAAAEMDLERRLASDGTAALVFEGFMTPEGGERTDALILSLLGAGPAKLGMVWQLYVPARSRRIPLIGRRMGFRLLGPPQAADELGDAADRIIAEGVREHPHGPRLWGDALG